HVAPPSNEVVAPPSCDKIIVCGLVGLIHSRWLSECGDGLVDHVAPPSVVLRNAKPGAYTTSEFFGSTVMLMKYHGLACSPRLPLMRRHVAPASSERYMPPESASTNAYTRFGVAGAMARPIRPIIDGSPVPSRVHVSPPSVVFQMPEPTPPDWI